MKGFVCSMVMMAGSMLVLIDAGVDLSLWGVIGLVLVIATLSLLFD